MTSALDVALADLPAEHRAALEWFVSNESRVEPRPWRDHGRSVVSGVSVPIVAQRGIHVPSGWGHAVSITATRTSKYGDGMPVDQGDGTWVLLYKAHSGDAGSVTKSRWNRGLIRCLEDRVPVGVFVPATGGAYLNLGLAMVDAYYPEVDAFELHGPVKPSLDAALFDFVPEILPCDETSTETWPALLLEDELASDERLRVAATVVRRERQTEFRQTMLRLYATCAVTGYDAPQTLEAAHILAYRGKFSHHPRNGLLLRSDIHQLFDRHLLSVDPSNRAVCTSPTLRPTKYRELEGRTVRFPSEEEYWPDPARLELHFEVFREVSG